VSENYAKLLGNDRHFTHYPVRYIEKTISITAIRYNNVYSQQNKCRVDKKKENTAQQTFYHKNTKQDMIIPLWATSL